MAFSVSFCHSISGILIARGRTGALCVVSGAIFDNLDIIESRAPFAVKSRRDGGESEEGGVGRKKKMAVGAAYANNSRLARSRRVARPSVQLDSMFSTHPLSFFLSRSSFSPIPLWSVCPVFNMPRPISVPPHLSLFANRKGASRAELWSHGGKSNGKRYARGLGDARHGWRGAARRGASR